MRNRMKNAVLLLLAACMLFACAGGQAESMHREITNDAFDMEVVVGYEGIMTYGKVMPVRVRIRNFGDDFEGVLGMNAYVSSSEYDRYEKKIFVPAGSERVYELALTVYSRQNLFTAEIVQDGEVVCAATGAPSKVINPSAMMIGILSTRPQNMNNLNIDRDNDSLARYELWQTIALDPETFPEDASVLRSFGMIVIDDVDPSMLSQKQQETLKNWLNNGRVIICGGGSTAGRNIPYFSGLTGLKLEDVGTSDSVMAGLESLIGRSRSGKKVSAAAAELSGAEPLARDAEGHGLVWRTEAGGGRIYTTAFEAGDARLNSENLMHYFWQQLLVDQDQNVYSSMMYAETESFSNAAVNAGYATPVSARSNLVPGILVVAGALVLGCIAWLILKRKDKRQWMWTALPVISVLAIAGIILLTTGAETTRPMAVVTENIVQDSTGKFTNYSGIAVAAPEFGRHSYSSSGENLRVQIYDYVDYDEDDESKLKEPVTLRTSYTAGGEETVTVESKAPWETYNFTTEGPANVQGRIDGTVWMEEDGLHGEIINNTDLKLDEGYVITTYGYAKVPALDPGEKKEFVLLRKTMANPQNPKYKDGEIYLEVPNIYTVISTAVGYNDDAPYSGKERQAREMAYSMINGASDVLRRGLGSWSSYGYEAAQYMYSAKAINTTEATVSVDGIQVEQKSSLNMVHAALNFATVGRTGVVFRSAGMDMPVLMDIDENLMPTEPQAMSGRQTYYQSLTDTPTFRYTLEGVENVKFSKLQVQMEYYYEGQARAYALNVNTGKWEEIKLNKDIENPGKYLDSKGQLFLQFRSDSSDMYADIPMPMITLEGRVDNAAD